MCCILRGEILIGASTRIAYQVRPSFLLCEKEPGKVT